MKMNWKEALTYSTYLLDESRWSRSLYSYQKAAILCMMKSELSDSEKQQINVLMK